MISSSGGGTVEVPGFLHDRLDGLRCLLGEHVHGIRSHKDWRAYLETKGKQRVFTGSLYFEGYLTYVFSLDEVSSLQEAFFEVVDGRVVGVAGVGLSGDLQMSGKDRLESLLNLVVDGLDVVAYTLIERSN